MFDCVREFIFHPENTLYLEKKLTAKQLLSTTIWTMSLHPSTQDNCARFHWQLHINCRHLNSAKEYLTFIRNWNNNWKSRGGSYNSGHDVITRDKHMTATRTVLRDRSTTREALITKTRKSANSNLIVISEVWDLLSMWHGLRHCLTNSGDRLDPILIQDCWFHSGSRCGVWRSAGGLFSGYLLHRSHRWKWHCNTRNNYRLLLLTDWLCIAHANTHTHRS